MNENINRLKDIAASLKRMNSKVKLLNLINKAKEEYNNYNYKSSNETLEKAYQISPEGPIVLRGLGCLKQFEGNYEDALSYFEKALEFSNQKEIEYTLIGMLYYTQNMLDEAIKNFNAAIDINDNYTPAYEKRNQAMLEYHIKISELQELLKKYF